VSILESGRLHGVFLHLHHADDPLLGARVEGHALLRRSVSVGRGQ